MHASDRLGAMAGRFALPVLLAAAAMPGLVARTDAVGPGPGQTRLEYATRIRESKARARELMSEDAQRRMAEAKRHAAAMRAARRRGLPPPAPAPHLAAPPVNEDDAKPSYEVDVSARRYAVHAGATVPANLRVNDTAADRANTAQSGASIASSGRHVLVAWNDGLGPQHVGYGYSTDGGQTFADGGAPPAPLGWIWSGDPVLTINEKTGTFYYCARVEPTAATNGIAVVPATFSDGAVRWGSPVLVRSVGNATAILDKPWMVADSASGNLYLTYTTFDGVTADHVAFQRSVDGGRSWSAAAQISSPSDNGAVQGSRPAVGPAGELYATWLALGTGAEDHIRLRSSTNQGASWGAEVTPASVYLNFGTGAPGLDRERGVDVPSIAVDRTAGADRGRIHLAWTECVNRYDDPVNTLGSRTEDEGNDCFAHANAFTAGQRLHGALSSRADLDYFSFTASEGTSYVFECDSVPGPLYTLRVFCGRDTTTRLAFSGDLTAPAGGHAYIVWTAPVSGTFYLRMAHAGGSSTGGYRISTGVAGVGTERGRDARDVFAAYSDDGVTWSSPALASDAGPRYNEYLPQVQVATDGMPYVTWFDWRDDGCAGKSYQYVTRSTDGGESWGPSQRSSDAQNNWTNISLASDRTPAMGDRGHLCADGGYLRPVWTDGRGGSPDVYSERIATGFGLTACQGDLAADPSSSIQARWTVTNLNPLFSNPYTWTLTSQRHWPLPASGSVVAPADGTADIRAAVAIPDTAAPGVHAMQLVATDARGAQAHACSFVVTIQRTPVSVPILASEFALQASTANPTSNQTRIDFSLPFEGPVRLGIYGLRGELIRTLADGERPAGPNTVTWDGRDDRGSRAGAGAYFCRLEGFGNVRVQRLIWLR